MSREELIEEIISVTKRLEEIEAARKETDCQISELSKQEEMFTGIEKQSVTASTKYLSLYQSFRIFINSRMKGWRDYEMRLMQWKRRKGLFTEIIVGDFDSCKLSSQSSA